MKSVGGKKGSVIRSIGGMWPGVASVRVSGNASRVRQSGIDGEPGDEHSSLEERQLLGGNEASLL